MISHNYNLGVTSFADFMNGGFIIVTNFNRLKLKEGNLQLKIKYSKEQNKKSVLLVVPIYAKNLVIDKNAEVLVQ